MKFALIVCTYMRPGPLQKLLDSVAGQTLYPDQIIIVDGSVNPLTKMFLETATFRNLEYFLVTDADRGLTRQRNFGIAKVVGEVEVVCFLDDDTILEADYFEKLIGTYATHPDALGVGGYILDEAPWKKVDARYSPADSEFLFDGWVRPEPSRFVVRKRLGLDADRDPGYSPGFSHGRSLGFLPPSGKVYRVDQLMGGVSSLRKSIFEKFQFSRYFEGYGLYEDADFTLRVSKTGALYLNTAATLHHYHDPSGRPNQFSYGRMVVRNGYYVWRVGTPRPSVKDRFKWHAITLLLAGIRFTNAVSGPKRMQALTEAVGRLAGWGGLLFDKPKDRLL